MKMWYCELWKKSMKALQAINSSVFQGAKIIAGGHLRITCRSLGPRED